MEPKKSTPDQSNVVKKIILSVGSAELAGTGDWIQQDDRRWVEVDKNSGEIIDFLEMEIPVFYDEEN